MQVAFKLRPTKSRRGALTLEWILIITVLVIGVIGGLGLVRNAVVEQMQDMAASIQDLQVQPEDTMTMMALPEGSGVQTPSGDQNATE